MKKFAWATLFLILGITIVIYMCPELPYSLWRAFDNHRTLVNQEGPFWKRWEKARENDRWQKEREESRQQGMQKVETIKEELKRLGDHPWAGEYTTGAGLSVRDVTIAPESGFVFHDYGDVYDFWYLGNCTFENGRIKLNYTGEKHANLPNAYVPVRWGERCYLIRTYPDLHVDCMKFFCEDVIRGYEPRYHNSGTTLLRKGDWKKPVEGLPELPAGFEQYATTLREHMIDAKILATGEVKTVTGERGDLICRISVMIDKGKDAGVIPSQKYVSGNLIQYGRLQFTKVGEKHAEGTFEFFRYLKDEDNAGRESTRIVPGRRVLMAKDHSEERVHAIQETVEKLKKNNADAKETKDENIEILRSMSDSEVSMEK